MSVVADAKTRDLSSSGWAERAYQLPESLISRLKRGPAARYGFLVVLGTAALLAMSSCDRSGSSGLMNITLLERSGGQTRISMEVTALEDLGNGQVRYSGRATAVIAGDARADRAQATVVGNAEAVVDHVTNEREFTFTSTQATDLGWSGVEAPQVSISGSGSFESGPASLVAAATLDPTRASTWGFSTSVVDLHANLSAESPIYSVWSSTGSAGNPLALVGAPNPGGVPIDAHAMGIVFAPVSGDSALGPVAPGTWVKLATSSTVDLRSAATLAWDRAASTLRGGGRTGSFSVAGTSIDATIELTATASASELSFSGNLDVPQLGILTYGSGRLWTDRTCTDCADIFFGGRDIRVSTLSIPAVVATQQIRGGLPVSSVIRAQDVSGSLGPITISDGDLTVDFSNPSNLLADLHVSGTVLGIPITTTFHGPFSFDLTQGSIALTGAVYLNLGGQVVLNGNLNVQATLAGGVVVDYGGTLALPRYGASFDLSARVGYEISRGTLGLNATANGTLGTWSASGVAMSLDLTPSVSGGVDLGGSLLVGSVSSGQASVDNVKVRFSGNTAGLVTASLNSAADRARVKIGNLADVSGYGSLRYSTSSSSLLIDLSFDGRVGSWNVSRATLSASWPSSSSVTGTLSIGNLSRSQVTLQNAVVDFTASSSSVTAALRPTSLAVGTMVSATVQGSASYNASNNTVSLSLQASGRVGSWNVSGVSVTLTWPGSGNVSGSVMVGRVSNGQVTLQNAVVDFTASSSSVTAALRPTTLTAGSLVSATVAGTGSYNVSTSTLTLSLQASGRVGPVNVSNVAATVVWPQSGNVTGAVTVGTIAYGPASLTGTVIGFSASSTTLNASISSTLSVGDPFRLNVGLSGSATYDFSSNTLSVSLTTGTGTMWGKPINGSVTFNVNANSSAIWGSAFTSSLRFSYDKFGITLGSTTVNFSVSGGTVSVSGSGSVTVNGPVGNGWLSGTGSVTLSGSQLRSTSYRITLNNANKTIIWVDVGPRSSAPLTVDIVAGSLSYDTEGKMRARVDTGFPFGCEDLEFKIHAWGDQNVLRVDFEGSWVIGLFGARGHVDVYDWLSSTNPPMYGYADVRITFFWFRYQTWNGQNIENGGC